ncbi:unnamed protein product [Acanthoscelides obtectus]|uniref:Osiris 7 n=1 Tax=Acanthoscelides obtectus TaxID=200917 RepID=A0A9P0LS15_ACAOB|nr:unnamed protein product [Acanthoscelides obtectus]CAK1648152.1 hypothetical protein AOBTE_LOCUS15565 [Acanthoscelides obtectus]
MSSTRFGTAIAVAAVLLCSHLMTSAIAHPTADNSVQTENDLLDSIYSDCLRKDSMSCLKYKIFNFVDKMLGHKDTITVTEGVQIVKTGEKDGAPRAISGDDTIETVLFNRIANFLDTHTIKVDIKGSEIVNAVSSTARSLNEVAETLTEEEIEDERNFLEEGRGKKKKANRILGPLMAAIMLKGAVMGKLALAAIAMIAGKALLVGKIALVLSAIIGLKKLLGQQGKHVTYEVVAHPQHSSSHISTHETAYAGSSGGGYGGDVGYSGGSSGHGGWGRSLDAQNLAYRGQPQAQS